MRFRRLWGMLLLLACMAAYWLNFEKRFAELEAETALKDPAKVLSATERERLLALRATLQKQFGITARLVIRPPDAREDDRSHPENILYMAVTPQTGAALVVLPSLASRVLAAEYGPEPEQRLAERLSTCVRRNPVQRGVGTCLETTLIDMLLALDEPAARHSAEATPAPVAPEPPANAVRGPLRESSPSSSDPRTTP